VFAHVGVVFGHQGAVFVLTGVVFAHIWAVFVRLGAVFILTGSVFINIRVVFTHLGLVLAQFLFNNTHFRPNFTQTNRFDLQFLSFPTKSGIHVVCGEVLKPSHLPTAFRGRATYMPPLPNPREGG
jgi:hypothetical protein